MSKRPNILIFMTDQQNGRTVQDGHRLRAKTPHLDRFRKRAVSFTNAYSPSPHCCPSRASFHSSRYPSEHGVWNNVNVSNALARGPRAGVPFWSRSFADAGYRMLFGGKWHVSNDQRPSTFGWQEFCLTFAGFGEGMDTLEQYQEARVRELKVLHNASVKTDIRSAGEIIRPGWPRYTHFSTDENPFGDGTLVSEAVSHIHTFHEENPWCLYVGTQGPHDPYTPPDRFLDWYDVESIQLPQNFHDVMDDKPGLYGRTRDRFDQLTEKEHRDAIHHYLAFCSYEDELFGQLLTALEETGQLDETIIVFTSDHGDYAAEHGLWGKGLPPFQPAYHVPLLIGGPGITVTDQTCIADHPVSLLDVGPTLAELCSIQLEGPVSGQSQAGYLAKGLHEEPRDIFFQSNGNEAYGIQRVIVSGTWKLVHNMFDHDELYDLQNDPDETCNLLARPSAERIVGRGPLDTIPAHLIHKVEELYGKLWRFALDHTDENINGYILTALSTFGPGIAYQEDSTGQDRKEALPNVPN